MKKETFFLELTKDTLRRIEREMAQVGKTWNEKRWLAQNRSHRELRVRGYTHEVSKLHNYERIDDNDDDNYD